MVVYDQSADVLLPLAPVTSPATVHQAIANVVSGDATNLFDGWQADAKQLESGQDKVQHLRTLAERDIKMMSKEVQYSSMKMSSRLQSRDETRYRGDETNEVSAVLPSFLRKKAQEGKGRSQPPVADHPPKTTINSDLAP